MRQVLVILRFRLLKCPKIQLEMEIKSVVLVRFYWLHLSNVQDKIDECVCGFEIISMSRIKFTSKVVASHKFPY